MHEVSLIRPSDPLTQRGFLWLVWMYVHILYHCWPPTHHLEPPRFENLAVDVTYHTYTLDEYLRSFPRGKKEKVH